MYYIAMVSFAHGQNHLHQLPSHCTELQNVNLFKWNETFKPNFRAEEESVNSHNLGAQIEQKDTFEEQRLIILVNQGT